MMTLAVYQLGMWEMMIILMLILLLFGAKRLPEMGRSLGQGIKEFKRSLTFSDEEEEKPSTKEGQKIAGGEEPPLNKHNAS